MEFLAFWLVLLIVGAVILAFAMRRRRGSDVPRGRI